ncbi:uncharacterized protein STEHIDRAFT_151133 [Stereum hirsutum FP-91666 SS1]|uniref:uncharacterized protein n=1 Tax=Stereum hirsutum (strain FP-91666) TaxID=721885 RepID=UPI000441060E|nr:uncharacterized protein STEHIDRAFT_151133 [Stereum hirsutum FP-91666 SS1]EIM91770.1 hypothetical protein STEHIDRAFT_151133 [Stereum hirsutum FP-91666 SS1]
MVVNGAHYMPLLPEDGDVLKTYSNAEASKFYNLHGYIARLAFIILSICAIVDTFLAFYVAFCYLESLSWKAISVASSNAPPLRSTYIGFDEIYTNRSQTTQHAPIVNLPRSSIQVSSTSGQAFVPLVDALITDNGMVPVYSNRVWVNDEVSTIIQFRVIDYGMEDCSLTMTVPNVVGRNSSFVIGDLEEDRASKVDVWRLPGNSRIDIQATSWGRGESSGSSYVGHLAAAVGSTAAIARFPCKSGSYFTFKLSCATADCGVDITTFKKEAAGLYLLQYQTV